MSTAPVYMSTDPEQRGHHGRRPGTGVRSAPGPGGGGFTLIEVVAALMILVLLAGAVFAVVSGATQVAAETERIQRENRRIRSFIDQCRDLFARLPAGASVELKIVENAPLLQELIVRGANEAFVFGPDAAWEVPELTLAFRRVEAESQAEGEAHRRERFHLALSTPNFHLPVPENAEIPPRSPIRRREGTSYLKPDREGRFWMELLPDMREATWRFYDPGKKRWEDKGGASRPPMIELTLLVEGRSVPVRAVFSPGG